MVAPAKKMKVFGFSVPRFVPLLVGVCGLFLATASKIPAESDDPTGEALAVAKTWMAQIDAGQYEAGYADAGDALHERVAEDRWVLVLKTLRTPLGEIVSRRQTSHIYKPNGYEKDEGEFVVISYDTSLTKLPQAMEVVVLKREGGRWRPAGYNIGPKPVADDGSTPPSASQTETHTDPHVKPQGQ
jgi:hypothetical protein